MKTLEVIILIFLAIGLIFFIKFKRQRPMTQQNEPYDKPLTLIKNQPFDFVAFRIIYAGSHKQDQQTVAYHFEIQNNGQAETVSVTDDQKTANFFDNSHQLTLLAANEQKAEVRIRLIAQ